jgi:hypothetical protein
MGASGSEAHFGARQEGLTMRSKSTGSSQGKRELIEPHSGDKRYVRRDSSGRISESDDVSKSLGRDVQQRAKTVTSKGQGDRGDRKQG